MNGNGGDPRVNVFGRYYTIDVYVGSGKIRYGYGDRLFDDLGPCIEYIDRIAKQRKADDRQLKLSFGDGLPS